VTGGWRKLHDEELHSLYSSPSIIRMIKPRAIRWTEHVESKGRRGMHIGYWWESQKERDHWEDLDVDWKDNIKWIQKKQDGVIWLRIGTSPGLL
jgi:hypothetical protein